MLLCIAGKNDIAVEGLLFAMKLQKKYMFDLGILCNKTESGQNGWQRSLRWHAQKYGIQEYTLDNLYLIDDLVFLSLEYDAIIKPDRFRTKRLYNIHYSLLPSYKGMYTSAIPLLNGETHSGVTLHYIDAGIDTGRIIAQKEFVINEADTCRDLYFKYTKHAISLLDDYLETLICSTEIISHEQSADKASYYSKSYIDYQNLSIDLNQVSSKIYNSLRAFHFREYQLPVVFGKRVIASHITNQRSTAKPGSILSCNSSGCIIATIDYNISLYWDRFDELMEACQTGNQTLVSEICLVKEHINQVGKNGWTPLMVATYNGQYEIVQMLILNGADITAVNYNGTNLLMYAKASFKNNGDCRLFELFSALGLKPDVPDYSGHDLKYYCELDHINSIGSIQI